MYRLRRIMVRISIEKLECSIILHVYISREVMKKFRLK